MFLEIMTWALLLLFVAILVWDIAVGKPTRWYSIKKGLNTMAKVFTGLGLLLGFYVCIMVTPYVLDFFNQNLKGEVYGLSVYSIAAFYWVSFILLTPLYLVNKVVSVNPFVLSGKELEWEKQKAEKDRRDQYEARKKFGALWDKILVFLKLKKA